MNIFGIMLVRNEADIVEVNLRHHVALGLRHILIADNDSTDGTGRVLSALARTLPITWYRAAGAFDQSTLTSELALEACLRGADWVLPIDADEFWYTPGRSLAEILHSTSASVLAVEVINFIQRRDCLVSSARGLLDMTRRPPQAKGPISQIERLVDSGEISFVEIEYPPKHIARASLSLRIGQGNHKVDFAGGRVEPTAEVICLHAPLRSRRQLEIKVDGDRAAEELDNYLKLAWHVRRWRQIGRAGRLTDEWRANSYADDVLDLGGSPRSTVFDPRLRDAVAPWVDLQIAHGDHVIGPLVAPPVPGSSLGSSFTAQVLARVDGIEGWRRESEVAVLMAAAAAAVSSDPHLAIVEVGSYCGKSTVAIASAAKAVDAAATVYAIDPHEGLVGAADTPAGVFSTRPTLESFQRNVAAAGLDDVVRCVVGLSYEVAWTEPIGLLFIDGWHDYESVARDYHALAPFVRPGGLIVFDDYDVAFPGVIRFVDERIAAGEISWVGRAGGVALTHTQGPGGVERGESVMAEDDVAARAARYENGLRLLRELLFRESDRHQQELAERDATIVAQQAELFEKVGDRDRTIRALQAELHAKVGERDRIIDHLQKQIARQ